MENITINGKSYKAKEVDFDFVADMEIAGIPFGEFANKTMASLRYYIAYCMDIDVSEVGAVISEHLKNGGSFKDLMDAFGEKIEESGFFQALQNENQGNKAETSKNNTKKEKEA
jgi:hypothetical protein